MASEIILVTCGLVSGVIALLSHPVPAAPSKCYVPSKQILNEWLLAFIYNLQELNATLNLFHNLPFEQVCASLLADGILGHFMSNLTAFFRAQRQNIRVSMLCF